jgi:hypothetical protein
MKLSSAILLLAGVSAVEGKRVIQNKAAMTKALRNARRVEENAQEGEFDFLGKYNMKMISCLPNEQVQSGDNGETEYGGVLVRLCPSESGCDSDKRSGCSSGNGDFVIGINTFVQAYFEDQRENMQNDDGNDFNINEFADCREYNYENDDDGEKVAYYVGPTCTSDGTDIKLGLFENYQCVGESSTAFEDISNGWSLPYNSGGVVTKNCMECVAQNDNGEYALRELCQNTYEAAAYKCETNMEYFSYYGKNEQGCETISALLPKKSKKSGSGGKVFGWIVFFGVIAGLASYVVWWRKKKAASGNDGIMS